MGMTKFERFSVSVTQVVGHFWTFLAAITIVAVWLCFGPYCEWSDTWQLWINTGTTIVTFLMVFLIQQSQNRDALKFQLKLDELVASVKGASNRVIRIEDFSESELRDLLRLLHTLPADRKSRSIEEVCHDAGEHCGVVHQVRADSGGAEGECGQGSVGSPAVEG